MARRDNNNILLNFNQSNDVDVVLVCDALEEAHISLCVYLWIRVEGGSSLRPYETLLVTQFGR